MHYHVINYEEDKYDCNFSDCKIRGCRQQHFVSVRSCRQNADSSAQTERERVQSAKSMEINGPIYVGEQEGRNADHARESKAIHCTTGNGETEG